MLSTSTFKYYYKYYAHLQDTFTLLVFSQVQSKKIYQSMITFKKLYKTIFQIIDIMELYIGLT